MLITRHNPSKSSSQVYTTQLDTATGQATCTCRGYFVKKGDKPRECCHTRDLIAEQGSYAVPAPATLAPAVAAHPGPKVKPMLASAMAAGQSLATFSGPDWIAEEKFDGHRLLITKRGDAVTAWSRPTSTHEANARDLPPAIITALRQLPDGTYDGELIVPGGTSSDVTRLDKRDALRLVLFDVIELLGRSLIGKTYTDRRSALDIAVRHFSGPDVDITDTAALLSVPPQFPVSEAGVQAIWDRGGEGAILKRTGSTYRSGWRTPDWVKVKRLGSAVLTITGFEAGKCGPYSKALLRGDDGLETSVKTLDNATRDDIARDPARYIGARLVVHYIEKMASGKLRHVGWDHLAAPQEDPRRSTPPPAATPKPQPKPRTPVPVAATEAPTASPAPSTAGLSPAQKAWVTRRARLAQAS
jgi:hypothetical protein